MKKLTTKEFKERYKDAISSFASQRIQSDLNYIWDCSGDQLLQELEEEGFDVSKFKNLYDFLPDFSECLKVEWFKFPSQFSK